MMIDLFDIVQNGTFSEFITHYSGDINQLSKEKINLLMMTLTSNSLPDEKIKIIKFLIDNGIDINYKNSYQRNALHNFFQYKANWNTDVEYAIKVLNFMLEAGIDVNQKDKFGSIPLIYAITLLRLPTEEAMPIYKLLLKFGSNPKEKNQQGKSAIDYSNEFSWRNSLVTVLEDYE